ncbi:MAG: MlaD family protein [Solirubrobacterales bacterium]
MTEAAKKPKAADYDERIYRKGHPPHRARNALILIAIMIFGTYLAITKSLPFTSEYELKAVFENAANIRKDSPVRIAGVNVGKVTAVRGLADSDDPELQNAAEVTFTVEDGGQPVREDAQVEIRPRIFLEGNFFLDLKPGSPSAEELPDNGTIPITQTATAVQLDQILTTLQAPDRESLQRLLQGYGDALNHVPTAAEDAGEDPDIQGETAAQAINDSFKYGTTAARDSAIVNEALLGTEPGDLSELIFSGNRVFNALLARESQLQDLITNLNITAGAFAAESENVSETVRLLAPTLRVARPSLLHTNQTLPYLRAFARDVEPGIRELPATIAVSGPWLKQTRKLLRRDELGRLAYQLSLTGEPAAQAAVAGPGLFRQTELLSRCVSNVLIPTGDVVINDAFDLGVPGYKEFAYAVTGYAGETQNYDGNGPYIRYQTGGGPLLLGSQIPGGGFENDAQYGRAVAPAIGTQPVMGNKPPYRTDVPCYVNAIPDLNGPAAAIGPPSPSP